ncbi:hypothetical protein E4P40_16810 [Blastococcus sp. CT_GayMR20]|nr:hypothetical protein E4P40_16810 [Blastococcus sp. CT_GayMR20]
MWLARDRAGWSSTGPRTRWPPRSGTAGPGRRAQGGSAADVRPAQRAVPGPICAGRAWPGVEARRRHRAGGAGLSRRFRRPAALSPLVAFSCPRPGPRLRGAVLGGPVADLPAATDRRAGPRRPVGPRPGPLAGAGCRHHRRRRRPRRPDGQHRRTDPDHAARRGHQPCSGVRRVQPAHRPFPSAEHLYSATGLAPASYQSASLNRRGRISSRGFPSTATP